MKTAKEMKKPAEEMAEMIKGLTESQKELVRGVITGIRLCRGKETENRKTA